MHIQDLAEFYMLLLDKALKGKAHSGPDAGYYFVESGEHQFGALVAQIGADSSAANIAMLLVTVNL